VEKPIMVDRGNPADRGRWARLRFAIVGPLLAAARERRLASYVACLEFSRLAANSAAIIALRHYRLLHPDAAKHFGASPGESNFLACNGRDIRRFGRAKSFALWVHCLPTSSVSLRI
jgi:hypothetical protein